jgi:hypothetical protein
MPSNRTDAKIRFAQVMLDDLRDRPGGAGDDFQRSREEAFWYHLFGAIDAFLNEVNEHHGFLLPAHKVNLANLEADLKKKCRVSAQLDEIRRAQNDPSGFLHRLKDLRDVSTHRGGISRTFYQGGPEHGQRRVNDATGQPSGKDILEEFDDALVEMRKFIDRLRADLVATLP